jgi:hypothetical protein
MKFSKCRKVLGSNGIEADDMDEQIQIRQELEFLYKNVDVLPKDELDRRLKAATIRNRARVGGSSGRGPLSKN